MGRRIGPRAKLARRYGVNLFSTGAESTSLSRTLAKRNYPPGVHGIKGRPKLTGYGEQLVEKQKAKIMYGLMERQFKGCYLQATKEKGNAADNLLRILESRLDNVVYRLGLAKTRAQARQMVTHGLIDVNAKKVDIPSFKVKIGDEVGIRENKKKSKLFENIEERLKAGEVPSWLSLDDKKLSGKVLDMPTKEEKESLFDIKAIIEFYSR